MIVRIARAIRDLWALKADPIQFARRQGVSVGESCRLLGLRRETFGSEPYLIEIGNHVTVTAGVKFITHDGGVWVFRNEHPDIDLFGRIVIEDNVFIGVNAILLPGVRVGRNSVVAAGAVVARDVPSGVVVGGVPARTLCTIAEYWAKHAQQFDHVRSLPAAEKRQALLRKYSR